MKGACVKVRLDVYADQRAKAKLNLPGVKLRGLGGVWRAAGWNMLASQSV